MEEEKGKRERGKFSFNFSLSFKKGNMLLKKGTEK